MRCQLCFPRPWPSVRLARRDTGLGFWNIPLWDGLLAPPPAWLKESPRPPMLVPSHFLGRNFSNLGAICLVSLRMNGC